LLLAGCGAVEPTFASLSEQQLAVAFEAAAAMPAESIPALVDRIHAARVGDPAVDTRYSSHCSSGGRSCPYSRAATAALIRTRWGGANLPQGATLREQTSEEGGFATTNFLLDLPGRSRPGEWVLATAHYDAWFGGANDNATGVAVVLEAGPILARLPLDRSVRLLLVDGEELGMVGSGRYVAAFGTEDLVVALNADMVAHVGTPGTALTRQPPGVEYLLQANWQSAGAAFQMADLARRLPRPVAMRPLIFPDDGVSLVGVILGVDLSDHAHFWLSRIPALFPFPAGDKPSWYHTAEDTPDKVDRDRLVRVARLWCAALAAFATVPR
jgi:hypothetical protein